MVASIHTVAFQGIDVLDIEVQVQVVSGLPAFIVVGLPDKAVAESRERVRGALTSIGLSLPPRRIIVNLSPADVVKEGSHFDLPIALGVLLTMEVLPSDAVDGYVALGELALDGSIRPVAGCCSRRWRRRVRTAGSSAPRSLVARQPLRAVSMCSRPRG